MRYLTSLVFCNFFYFIYNNKKKFIIIIIRNEKYIISNYNFVRLQQQKSQIQRRFQKEKHYIIDCYIIIIDYYIPLY